jgi:four helix bundle protein
MARSIICERSFEFACRILPLCSRVWQRGPVGRHIASQLMKCGTSIGSNAEEAQDAQSKRDFIAKMSVSRKEARETVWWIRLALRTQVVTNDEIEWEVAEAGQLRAMIVAAIKTAQANLRRRPKLRRSPNLSNEPEP